MRLTFESYDTMMDLSTMEDSPYQTNKHDPSQIKQLAKIMDKTGISHPIHLVRGTKRICFGHARRDAAKFNKWTQYPVVFHTFQNEDEEKVKVTSDNAIALQSEIDKARVNEFNLDLGPDFDPDLWGLKDFVIEPADKYAGCDEDEVPEKVEPKTKLGDLYQLGSHRLLCGDSTSIDAVEKLMNGEKAEICFTSPPYIDQRLYNNKNLDLSLDKIASFIPTSFLHVNFYAIVLGIVRKDKNIHEYWNEFIKSGKDCGLKLLSWNVWNKGFGGSIGMASAMFTIDHEFIFILGQDSKDLNRVVPNKRAGDLPDHRGIRNQDGSISKAKPRNIHSHRQMGTVTECFGEKSRNHGCSHPAMFPVKLPEMYIEGMTSSDHIIYEPFGGSGSTLIACEKTNRKCFMSEIDPHYCDVIVARWEKYSGKKAELIPDRNAMSYGKR